MHNEFKIDVNKRYITANGNVVVFSPEEEDKYLNAPRANRLGYLFNPYGTVGHADNVRLSGVMIDIHRDKYQMKWNEDGTVLPYSIPSALLKDATAEDFTLKEYQHVDIIKYFKSREDELKKLIYKRQQLCKLLGSISSIDIIEEAEAAILKIAEYRDYSNKILELMQKDVNAIYNMEKPDSTLLKVVNYNITNNKKKMDDFEEEYILNIEMEIANVKYGYISVYQFYSEDEDKYKLEDIKRN